MSTKLVMIHGRNQASDQQTADDPAKLAAYVDNKKRQFLAGLAKGLVLANRPPIVEGEVIFPFYGNVFRDSIADYERSGGIPPHLEAADPATELEVNTCGDQDQIRALSTLQANLLQDMAGHLDYDAVRELRYQGGSADELAVSDVLGVPFVTGALQFLSRKTGVPAAIIRNHLADVAYYIGMESMRHKVLDVVRREILSHTSADDDLVVIAHSLGSVVAYDLLADQDNALGDRRVKLFVTVGSPLGLKLVKARLHGRQPAVPAGAPLKVIESNARWLNGYDVLDIVALIHPLAPEFKGTDRLSDERTYNPTGPHAIIDYLADPDIAAPISDHMAILEPVG
ncbi:hypothetical protein ACRDU6_21110 [Mycolicibacterium sp. ELW1]|uniref:hypothetical protein n=1 Tax=Mycobacteriaceae TaxID=1762 RepID=UPI0011F07CAA|nr:hypothetical protein [Mycobacterium sp. ELW1]QEN14840.1 hypothetical protein D3H54_17650 [Mycobacterium sp. ELW1]